MHKKYNKCVVLFCSVFMFFYSVIGNAQNVQEFEITGYASGYLHSVDYDALALVNIIVKTKAQEITFYFTYPRFATNAQDSKIIPDVIKLYTIDNDGKENPVPQDEVFAVCNVIGSYESRYYNCYVRKYFNADERFFDYNKIAIKLYNAEGDEISKITSDLSDIRGKV